MMQKLMGELVLGLLWKLTINDKVLVVNKSCVFVIHPLIVEVAFYLPLEVKFDGPIVVVVLDDAKKLVQIVAVVQ